MFRFSTSVFFKVSSPGRRSDALGSGAGLAGRGTCVPASLLRLLVGGVAAVRNSSVCYLAASASLARLEQSEASLCSWHGHCPGVELWRSSEVTG